MVGQEPKSPHRKMERLSPNGLSSWADECAVTVSTALRIVNARLTA